MSDAQYDDIDTVRRRNMRLIVEQYGLEEVCKKLGIIKNQMRHWIGRTPQRNISRDVARKVERLYRLPENYMDYPHPENREPVIEQDEKAPLGELIEIIKQQSLALNTRIASLDGNTEALNNRMAQIESQLTLLVMELKDAQNKSNNPHKQANDAGSGAIAASGAADSAQPNSAGDVRDETKRAGRNRARAATDI